MMPGHHVFCDESHLKSPYRIQGGVWVPDESMRQVRHALTQFRTKHKTLSELKWNKVGGARPFTAHLEFVDLFFSLAAERHISFKCIVVHREDDESSTQDKYAKDLGFYKAYYLLLRWRLAGGCGHHVHLDRKTEPRPTPETELARCLNAAAQRDLQKPFRVLSCKTQSSKSEDLLQLADVLCGSVGWAWNGRQTTCGAKPILHDHICAHLGWPTLATQTSMAYTKFNIWRYQPKSKRVGASAT